MNIDREVQQGGLQEAIHRVKFVLDHIEKIECDLDFGMTMGKRLTYEEVIGALVSAEQELKRIEKDAFVSDGEKQ